MTGEVRPILATRKDLSKETATTVRFGPTSPSLRNGRSWPKAAGHGSSSPGIYCAVQRTAAIGQKRSYAPRANCSRHSTMPARSIAVQVAAAVGRHLVPTLYLHRPIFDDPIDRSCSPINKLTGTRLSLGTQVRPNVGHYCRRAAAIWCGLIVITRSQQSSPVTA